MALQIIIELVNGKVSEVLTERNQDVTYRVIDVTARDYDIIDYSATDDLHEHDLADIENYCRERIGLEPISEDDDDA